jgi:hypothetical protein
MVKKDLMQEFVSVNELVILELEGVEDEKGFMGLWGMEVKVCMDFNTARRKGIKVMADR